MINVMDRSSQWSEALELFDAMLERRHKSENGPKGAPVFLGEVFFFWDIFSGLNGFFVDICLGDLVVVQR